VLIEVLFFVALFVLPIAWGIWSGRQRSRTPSRYFIIGVLSGLVGAAVSYLVYGYKPVYFFGWFAFTTIWGVTAALTSRSR
jgi:hypothetical protein